MGSCNADLSVVLQQRTSQRVSKSTLYLAQRESQVLGDFAAGQRLLHVLPHN